MRNPKTIFISAIPVFLFVVALLLATSVVAVGDYMKMNPPPDVDKAEHGHGIKPTCWKAAAANMLAGAGYGDGNTVQERADDIYNEMIIHFGDANREYQSLHIRYHPRRCQL
jgi:hypothetical protein